MKKTEGLSIIEIIIVVALILSIMTVGILNIDRFRKTATLTNTIKEIVSILTSAQSKSIAGEEGKGYTVQFTSSTISLISETGFLVSKTIVDQNIVIVPPPADIVFEKVSGRSNGGTIIVKTSDNSQQSNIIVSQVGSIFVQ